MRHPSLEMLSRRARRNTLLTTLGAATMSLGLAGSMGAQAAPAPQPPTIFVGARGEVQVAPDRARVQVGVETRGATSAAAAQENNRKQAAILAAIRKLGIPNEGIQTLNYTVMPIQRWDDKLRRTVIDGYQVSNIVQVETDRLELAGQIIDAGLSNGANRVAGLDFFLKDRAKAQDAALTQAVASARRQAEVAARAAGGMIVELLELTINEFERPEPRMAMAMAVKMDGVESAPAPIAEGTATVSVSIGTRWRFAKQP